MFGRDGAEEARAKKSDLKDVYIIDRNTCLVPDTMRFGWWQICVGSNLIVGW